MFLSKLKVFPPVRYLRMARRRLLSSRNARRFVEWQKAIRDEFADRPVRLSCHGHSLFVDPADPRAFRMAMSGGTQKGLIEVWRRLLVAGPDAVIDVGANYGEFSAVAGEFCVPTLAIEPNPVVRHYLARSLSGVPSISILPYAVGDVSGITELHVTAASSGFSSLSSEVISGRSNSAIDRPAETSYEVELLTLDSLVAAHLPKTPKSLIIKIDVEGFEIEVLAGGNSVLSSLDWVYILLEFNPSTLRERGLGVQGAWEKIREFDGLILEKKSKRLILGSVTRLPQSAPTVDCDIVLFKGNDRSGVRFD